MFGLFEKKERTLDDIESEIKEWLTGFLCMRDDARATQLIDGLVGGVRNIEGIEPRKLGGLTKILRYYADECEAIQFTHSVSYHHAKRFVESQEGKPVPAHGGGQVDDEPVR